mmetsp:Transcript_18503/g.27714  ORF Transcript_18503/g.27714 Transcript_18503/m.27714 type:complete len:609 (-) Transcript_18503:201-2027(-)
MQNYFWPQNCVHKVGQIVVQSRLKLETAPRKNKDFRISTPEVPALREKINKFMEKNQNVIVHIEIDVTADGKKPILLERWSINYEDSSLRRPEAKKNILPVICLLIRSVYSYVKILPASRLARCESPGKEPEKKGYKLSYRIFSSSEVRPFDSQPRTFKFSPVESSDGKRLQINVSHRKDCHFKFAKSKVCKIKPDIIDNYINNPPGSKPPPPPGPPPPSSKQVPTQEVSPANSMSSTSTLSPTAPVRSLADPKVPVQKIVGFDTSTASTKVIHGFDVKQKDQTEQNHPMPKKASQPSEKDFSSLLGSFMAPLSTLQGRASEVTKTITLPAYRERKLSEPGIRTLDHSPFSSSQYPFEAKSKDIAMRPFSLPSMGLQGPADVERRSSSDSNPKGPFSRYGTPLNGGAIPFAASSCDSSPSGTPGKMNPYLTRMPSFSPLFSSQRIRAPSLSRTPPRRSSLSEAGFDEQDAPIELTISPFKTLDGTGGPHGNSQNQISHSRILIGTPPNTRGRLSSFSINPPLKNPIPRSDSPPMRGLWSDSPREQDQETELGAFIQSLDESKSLQMCKMTTSSSSNSNLSVLLAKLASLEKVQAKLHIQSSARIKYKD